MKFVLSAEPSDDTSRSRRSDRDQPIMRYDIISKPGPSVGQGLLSKFK